MLRENLYDSITKPSPIRGVFNLRNQWNMEWSLQ